MILSNIKPLVKKIALILIVVLAVVQTLCIAVLFVQLSLTKTSAPQSTVLTNNCKTPIYVRVSSAYFKKQPGIGTQYMVYSQTKRSDDPNQTSVVQDYEDLLSALRQRMLRINTYVYALSGTQLLQHDPVQLKTVPYSLPTYFDDTTKTTVRPTELGVAKDGSLIAYYSGDLVKGKGTQIGWGFNEVSGEFTKLSDLSVPADGTSQGFSAPESYKVINPFEYLDISWKHKFE